MWPEHLGQALQASEPSEGSPHPVIEACCALVDPQEQARHQPSEPPYSQGLGKLVIPGMRDWEEKVGLETHQHLESSLKLGMETGKSNVSQPQLSSGLI